MEAHKLCGNLNGEETAAAGNYVLMVFHTDGSVERRGFKLFYTVVPMGKCSRKSLWGTYFTLKGCHFFEDNERMRYFKEQFSSSYDD